MPQPDIGSATRSLSTLHRLGQVHLRDALAPVGIGAGQVIFLVQLFQEDGVTQDQLAQQLHMDKGTTARALRALEDAGFVRRKPDRGNRRCKRVQLTPRAHDCGLRLRNALDGWLGRMTVGFDDDERRAAVSLLHRMAENAAGIEGDQE